MIERRWTFLWVALACGLLLFVSPITPMQALPFNPDIPIFFAAMGAIGLQAVGTIGMRAHFRVRRKPAPVMVTISFIAALAWGVASLAAIWGQTMGPGGIVVGLLLMLPAAVIALALQVVTLIGFRRAERHALT